MNRNELLKALKIVLPGIAKGEVLLAGTDSFVFKPDLVQSYNDNLSVTYPYASGIEGAVKASELIKILEKMTSKDITVTVKEAVIELSDENTELSMNLIVADTVNLLDNLALDELEWLSLPSDFPEALALCLQSISRDWVHGPLMGVRIENQDVMSSDNFRATWVKLSESMTPFTLPGTAANDLLKLENLQQYAVTEGWVHFTNQDGVIFSSRLISSQFPSENLKKMFPQIDGKIYELPDEIDKALERAGIMAYQSGEFSYVNLVSKKNQLFITGKCQFGSIKEKIKLKPGAWPQEVSLNIQPGYLLDIMRKTKTFQVVDKLVYFYNQNFKHIIATVLTD